VTYRSLTVADLDQIRTIEADVYIAPLLVSDEAFLRLMELFPDGAVGAFEPGHFVPPTIFADARDEMRIVTDEIFGPVLCVLPFDSFDEVIARANATRFGLAGGVWTRDITRAMAAVRRIRAGSIWVNHYFAMDPSVPFGGYKMSGFGREGGSEHLDGYLQTKGVWIRNG